MNNRDFCFNQKFVFRFTLFGRESRGGYNDWAQNIRDYCRHLVAIFFYTSMIDSEKINKDFG